MLEKFVYILCASSAWQLTCLIFAIIGFIDIIVKVEFPQIQALGFPLKLIVGIFVLCVVYLICKCVITLARSKFKLLRLCGLNNGNALYLAFDDILDPKKIDYKERINIIIPANTTFETLVDNTVVSSKSLHGKAIMQLCNETRDYTYIRKVLRRSLLKREIQAISGSEKRADNAYPVGSIATICEGGTKCFHFLALSTFDKNVAHTSVNDLYVAVNKLAEQLGEISQGFPVLIPILGTDLSKTHMDQNDILKLLVLTIMMHKKEMTSNIYIVTLEEKRKSIIYPL